MTALLVGLSCLFGPLLLLCGIGAVTYLVRRLSRESYPPEAADPVDEHFTTSPTEVDQLEVVYRLPAYIKEQSNGPA